jgi:hypothetical protein
MQILGLFCGRAGAEVEVCVFFAAALLEPELEPGLLLLTSLAGRLAESALLSPASSSSVDDTFSR